MKKNSYKFNSSPQSKIVNITLFLLTFLMFNNAVYAEPITIRFSHVVNSETPKGQLASNFKQLVKERLGDEVVKVEIYDNSSLVNDDELADALINGQVEMGVPAISKLKKYSKRLQVFDIPFIFVSPEAVDNFVKGQYGKRMLRLVESKGLTGLGFLSSGMKQLSAKTPIKLPEDLKGLRYRIMNSDVLEAQFLQLDAVPLRKPFSQVYSLLRDNKIDGQENTWISVYAKKLHEHQPYFIESNHGYLGSMVLTSTKFWKSIPSEIRPVVEKSLAEALEYGNNVAKEKTISDREKIELSNKTNIHLMTIEERKKWVAAMQPVWKSYENEIGSELIQAAASAR
ncbi:MAG: DctP family TRAP transporter solute-binding subunit [Arenicella sp.]